MQVTPNPSRPNSRRLDDDLEPPRVARFRGPAHSEPDRAGSVMTSARSSGARPRAQLPPPPAVQNQAQRASYDALRLALQEGYVFAALTGPAGSGKTLVLDALLADLQGRALRCIRVANPDKVGPKLAAEIERVACTEAGKPENRDRHIVLVIDDAHAASDELLLCLSRISLLREPGQRVPQLLLVGRPQLWERLEADAFEPLARRLAVRSTLPGIDAPDPWASVEQELSEALGRASDPSEPFPGADLGMDRMVVPAPPPFGGPFAPGGWDPEHSEFGESQAPIRRPLSDVAEGPPVPPPTMFALFPEGRPAESGAAAAKPARNRLVVPLTTLFIAVAAAATVLSFYDWPDVLPDINWTDLQNLRVASSTPPSPDSPAPEGKPTVQVAAADPQPAKPAAASPPAAPPAPTQAAPPAPPAAAVAAPAAPSAEATLGATSPAPVAAPAPVVTATSEPAPPASPPPAEGAAPAPRPEPVRVQARAVRPAAPTGVAVRPELIAILLRRGQEAVAMGDLSAARLLFQRAAEGGSAVAARSVARTYDEAFLTPDQVNTAADGQAAHAWYVRAAALGDAESARRLQSLGRGQ